MDDKNFVFFLLMHLCIDVNLLVVVFQNASFISYNFYISLLFKNTVTYIKKLWITFMEKVFGFNLEPCIHGIVLISEKL